MTTSTRDLSRLIVCNGLANLTPPYIGIGTKPLGGKMKNVRVETAINIVSILVGGAAGVVVRDIAMKRYIPRTKFGMITKFIGVAGIAVGTQIACSKAVNESLMETYTVIDETMKLIKK